MSEHPTFDFAGVGYPRRVPHFRRLPADVTERLAARGIDPEQSCEAWLAAIRAGSFPIYANGLPVGPRDARLAEKAPYVLSPIPLAVVLPDPEREP